MSGDGFSVREVAGVLGFVVLAAAIGVGSYQTGLRVAGPQGTGTQVAAATGSAPVNGQNLYAAHCAGCHGASGGGGIGPSLAGAAGWAKDAFNAAVLHGQGEGGRELNPVMPRFAETGFGGEEVTEEQLSAIQAFLNGK